MGTFIHTCVCGQRLEILPEMRGKKGRCPQCQAPFTIRPDGAVVGEPKSAPRKEGGGPVAGPRPEEGETKPCPVCGESILLWAKKCKHCGEYLEARPPGSAENPGPPPGEAPPEPQVFFYIASGFVPLLGLILGVMYVTKPHPDCKRFGKICLIIMAVPFALGCLIGVFTLLLALARGGA